MPYIPSLCFLEFVGPNQYVLYMLDISNPKIQKDSHSLLVVLLASYVNFFVWGPPSLILPECIFNNAPNEGTLHCWGPSLARPMV